MKTNNALLFLSLVLFLVAAALSGCKSKKTIINQKTDDKITENIEYNDTTEDTGTIVIKTTRIDSNTTKKEIFINNICGFSEYKFESIVNYILKMIRH